jgi:hypothetical protein
VSSTIVRANFKELSAALSRSEQIAHLTPFGYSPLEARFLYLIITHSGYFTRRQFLSFTGKTKGWAVHHFTEKLLTRGHAKAEKCIRGVYLFRLCCREMYDALDKPNLRIRSVCSEDWIRARLLTLDFVMTHSHYTYLETPAEKLVFFTQKMGLPTKIVPAKTYSGTHFVGRDTLYFSDRCPIFFEPRDPSNPGAIRPVFVYCDSYPKALDAFKTHLKRYQDLLYRLPDFRFIYASPHPWKIDRAKAQFDRLMRLEDRADRLELMRYFRVRWLWDNDQHSELTREDRDRIRVGDKRFCGEPFVSIYRKWCQGIPGQTELRTMLDLSPPIQNFTFDTYLLPEQYGIFRYETGRPVGTKSRTVGKT